MDHGTLAKRREPARVEAGPRSFRRRNAQHSAPCQQRFAPEKAGVVGIDGVSENRKNAPRQLVEVAPRLPSVATRAFD
jgi:hypothetical protein